MKKALLMGLSASLFMLTGCGQNVDNIKKDFAIKAGTNAEQAFSGYTVSIPDSAIEKVKSFINENKIPFGLDINEQGQLDPFPDVKFKNGEFSQAVTSRDAYAEYLEQYRGKAQAEASSVVEKAESTIAGYQAQIDSLNSKLEQFNSLVADESQAYESAQQYVKAIEAKMEARTEQFHTEFSEAVVANNLPISKDQRVKPTRYYKHRSESRCRRYDQSEVTYLKIKSEGCVYSNIGGDQAVLAPIFASFGVDYENLKIDLKAAKEDEKKAKKVLQNAQTIAANKLDIDTRKVERSIASLNRNIERERNSMKQNADISRLMSKAMLGDEQIHTLVKEYRTAVRAYHLSVKREAILEGDYSVDEFDDEQAIPEIEDNEKGLAIYVFTNDADEQTVFWSQLKSGDTSTFGDMFKKTARLWKSEQDINDDDEAVAVLASMF
ncbi:hypothetical protein [Alteromonas sp. 14N.309.X.WAT.G.H12]|uniref:hypothetical protein n=1 Tax=Alteromonas sp. 14N.309.X.WAT.G.H12 TaxID=3120824 RepID=UPI002FD4DA8A